MFCQLQEGNDEPRGNFPRYHAAVNAISDNKVAPRRQLISGAVEPILRARRPVLERITERIRDLIQNLRSATSTATYRSAARPLPFSTIFTFSVGRNRFHGDLLGDRFDRSNHRLSRMGSLQKAVP